eukprot:159944-Rhodomonas_salina.1
MPFLAFDFRSHCRCHPELVADQAPAIPRHPRRHHALLQVCAASSRRARPLSSPYAACPFAD